jgi:N-acetylneuraminate lyase
MTTRPIKIEGVIPALASPCDENDCFLEDKFVNLISHLYSQGVHGVYVCGATGDGYNMRLEERKRAAELAVEVSREYGGLAILHIGCYNTRDAVELAEHAAHIEADAVASIPPVNRTFEQVMSYYTDVAKAAQLPTLIYQVPLLSHLHLTVEDMLRLLDIEGVTGMKYTDWNLFIVKRLMMARPDITILNGFDEVFCLSLINGAHGGVGTSYNLFPVLYVKIYNAVKAGNIARAMELQNIFLAFVEKWHKNGYRAVFEYLMRRKGYGDHFFRRPRETIDPELLRNIEPELNRHIADIEAAIHAVP